MNPTTIEINKPELAAIRRYLTSQRRGDGYSADDGDVVLDILKRVGFAAADTVFPMSQRIKGICVVCGCTEKDPCPADDMHIAPCSWEPASKETICSHCADIL